MCTLEEVYKSVGTLEEDKSVGTLEEDKPVGISVDEKSQETLWVSTQEESGSAAGTAALEKILG